MKVIFGIILALCIVVTIFFGRINEDDEDSIITQLYAGSMHEKAYSAMGNLESCTDIMMATQYTVPLNENDERKQRIQPALYAYDKYGTELIHHEYSSPQWTYSYKVDEDGNLKEVVWHYLQQGPESECSKTVLEYYPESNTVGITRWHGPVKSSVACTSKLVYELDERGLVTERTETNGSSDSGEGTTYMYQRDINGNVTHELAYSGDRLLWDQWHTFDADGNEIMAVIYDWVSLEPSEPGRLIYLVLYENRSFDECGNWTCRVVNSQAFFGPSGETSGSHMEYRSLLYYPD